MKTAILAFLLVSLSVTENNFAQLFDNPKETYVIITGVLEWKGSLSSFEKKNRKDAELHQYFKDIGVPPNNIFAYFDSQATLSNINKALEKVKALAKTESTIVFYYAGHGVKPKSKIYFANYDINTNNTTNTGFSVEEISKTFKNSKAKKIILLADCCYSGGLINECNKLGASGKQVLALTSATASNVSTGNWTFTQTLLDCFNGNFLADHNNDHIIGLKELEKEIFDAMKYRERQMAGYASKGISSDTQISKAKNISTRCTGNNICGKYFWARHKNNWAPVRITGKNSNSLNCEFYFYSDKETKQLNRRDLRPIYFVKHQKTAKVKVEWNKKWYKATIKDARNDFYYITYDGYDASWDEWVLYDRIRTGKEKEVQVKESGSYYPAIILEQNNSKYYIHYTDYSHSWDEWVGEERIKK